MRWATSLVGLLVFGLFIFMGIYFVLDGTIINEEDYHSLKEAMEGAMYDSVDLEYYATTGEIKIIKEKFVENFTRRFAETNAYGNKGFTIEYFDIIESPPKVSITINEESSDFHLSLDSDEITKYNIINKLDAILLYNTKHFYSYEVDNGDFVLGADTELEIEDIPSSLKQELNTVYDLNHHSNRCKIYNVEYVKGINEDEDDGSNIAKYCEIMEKFDFTNDPDPKVVYRYSKLDESKIVDDRFKKCKDVEPSGFTYRVTISCEY